MAKTNELTLPGDIPGLLRRCSPVLDPINNLSGIVLTDPAGTALVADVAMRATIGRPPGVGGWTCDGLLLDLGDATGRAHAARWLYEGHALNPHRGVSVWWIGRDTSTYRSAPRDLRISSPPSWVEGGDGPGNDDSLTFWAEGRAPGIGRPVQVPALASLDPNDPRLLDDGSRRVDAEALRLVCLHVAGRS